MRKWYMVYDIEWEENEDWLPSSKVVTIEDDEVSDFNDSREVEDLIKDELQQESGCNVLHFSYDQFSNVC